MKKELGAIVISLGLIFGTSCNKEEMFEKVRIKEGETKAVFSKWDPSGQKLYYLNNPFDTTYLWKFESKPYSFGFGDVDGDGLDDLRYTTVNGEDFNDYWVKNIGGSFGEAQEF